MAAAASLSFSLDPHRHLSSNPHFTPSTSLLIPKHSFRIFHNSNRYTLKSSSSSSSHSSTATSPSPPSVPSSSFLEAPLRTGRFLSNEDLEKLKSLENFRYYQELESGSMWVRVMRSEEMDITVGLLAESFAESMLLPSGYVALLGFLVKQYLMERRELMPHTATLIGFYRSNKDEAKDESFGGKGESFEDKGESFEEKDGGFGGEDEDGVLAGTVEVCFDKKGANASTPTPTPPKNSPYISNMAVKKSLRRRGIGWHLLKASEELISQMSSSREAYLHCRMIDAAPFNMYTKAGYNIVKTDSILILLTLQRRKHLMYKKLPVLTSFSESETLCSEEDENHY
ncbi:putative transcription regulator GNAT family [Rosa chinensis]|uniref:Putative transcription regulator GNAT family n=1 Tax=Rosa chinensis TaxID=74649 RepID=A0A2P6R463_ROSCH|nr:uncharacterized protein LOC112197811 [Rosa chinensis]PRQ41204.1 putative transcription regulator GNAT family [Rosa chinensis]